MVDKVITMGRTRETAILRGRGTPSAPIGGDFREIKFTCRFSADAVNGGTDHPAAPKPHIRVDVSTTTPEYLYQVEIVPPGGNQEVLRRSGRGGARSWARRVIVEDGRPQVAPRQTTSRALGDLGDPGWEWEDPWGELEEVDPIDPGGGGGGGGGGGLRRIYTRELDPASDEVGTWTVRVRNGSQDDERFTITVDHPETVQDLRETRIPFQLINRAFAQTLLMMQLRIKIDNGQARIEFDRTFRDLTGIENQVISVNERLQDINLESFKVDLVSEEAVNGGRIPMILAGLDLEERGTELDLPFHDVDVENLAIKCRIMLSFGYPKGPDFFETAMRRENGQVLRQSMLLSTYLDVHPNINDLWAAFLDQVAGLFGPSIGEQMQSAIDDAERSLAGQITKAEPYVQDVIMHLVDRDDVMFRIGADDDSIVVLHHRRPSFRDFLDDVISPDDLVVVAAGTRATPDEVCAPALPSKPLSSGRRRRRDDSDAW